MALKEINFTEPNCIKEYLSQNILQSKDIYTISMKFSKITLPYIPLNDIIIQVEYQNKFYRYYIFSKKPLYLPYPTNINDKIKIKLQLLYNSSQKITIIGKGSFHINKDNLNAKIFNKIIKIILNKEKITEIGLNIKKGDNTEINGTIFIEGNIINKNNLIKQNYYLNTNYNMNSSKNKANSSSNIANKELKNNLTKIKSKKIKKIKEEKILIGNKKRANNKFNKRFNFDLDSIDDDSIKFNYLSKNEFSNNNNSNNFSHLSSFEQNNEKISKNIQDNIRFYDNKINKNFNNDLINKLKGINIKDQIYKNGNIKEINSDLLKNISLNIDRREQELNKIYQDYYNEKNNEIEILKEKGIQSYKKYIELKKVLKTVQNEYLENSKNYEKLKNEINADLQKEIDNNNNYLKNNSNKTLNELFFSLSFKESDYFNNNKFINNNNINNINNAKKNVKDHDLETMVEILSSFPTDKIDILKGLTNLEKQDAVLIINSSLNKNLEEEKNRLNNENYNFDENENKTEKDDSSEDQESNTIIQIIEKCVNSYYNKKLIPKIQIEQIDTYHYTFENLKIELALDPDKENNLITSEGESFETWLVKNFAS